MLTAKKKEYFKKLLTKMMDDVPTERILNPDKDNGFAVMSPDFSDRAKSESELTFSLRMQQRKGGLVRKIEEALERIENGTYGVCEECEEKISESRLRARPVTTLCITCKRKQEENERFRE